MNDFIGTTEQRGEYGVKPERDLRQEWETPKELFDPVDAMFNFDIDVAASPHNAKCESYFVDDGDLGGLGLSWFGIDGLSLAPFTAWCNPPFGDMASWLAKALEEVCEHPYGTAVVLSPVDTSTRWWHDYATKAAEVWYLTPRVKFVPPSPDIKASNGPAGAHCLLVFRHLPKGATRAQAIVNWRWK